jgi:hypothetical protein
MSYLEGYGVRDARREKIVRLAVAAVLCFLIIGVFAYFFLRDRSEKQMVRQFVDYLRAGDYKSAYALWGCTDEKPCRSYPFPEFMRDWGPASPHANISQARISGGQHCTGGLIQVLDFPGDEQVQLLVDRREQAIGFNPWPIDTKAPEQSTRAALRHWMRDLVGDCSPPPIKVP